MRYHHQVASAIETANGRFLRGHNRPLTAVVLDAGGRTAFTASKDALIIKCTLGQCDWHASPLIACNPLGDLSTGQRVLKTAPVQKSHQVSKEHHTDQILTLALSSDGKFLVS